jgi:hypothetical protein
VVISAAASAAFAADVAELKNPPALGNGINLGGFSGLTHLPVIVANVFYAVTDRGPNGSVNVNAGHQTAAAFTGVLGEPYWLPQPFVAEATRSRRAGCVAAALRRRRASSLSTATADRRRWNRERRHLERRQAVAGRASTPVYSGSTIRRTASVIAFR